MQLKPHEHGDKLPKKFSITVIPNLRFDWGSSFRTLDGDFEEFILK
jgi:hypothetical protein